MTKMIMATLVLMAVVANSALAANVDLRVGIPAPPTPPGVKIQVGSTPPPQVVVERERTVVIKEKHDQGKHKGHKKHKKHKRD